MHENFGLVPSAALRKKPLTHFPGLLSFYWKYPSVMNSGCVVGSAGVQPPVRGSAFTYHDGQWTAACATRGWRHLQPHGTFTWAGARPLMFKDVPDSPCNPSKSVRLAREHGNTEKVGKESVTSAVLPHRHSYRQDYAVPVSCFFYEHTKI